MVSVLTAGVALFVAAMIFIGYKRGLIKTAFSLVSVLIVLILVQVLTPLAKEIIIKTPVYEQISEQISVYVEKNIVGTAEGISQTGVEAQENIIKSLPLTKSAKESLVENNTSKGYEALGVDNFSDYISAFLLNMILNAATFIILFVLLTLLVQILMHILDLISKLPVINALNKGGGAFLGLAQAVVILWIACIIVTLFSTSEWGEEVCKAIESSPLLSLIYDNNLIQNLLMGLFSI